MAAGHRPATRGELPPRSAKDLGSQAAIELVGDKGWRYRLNAKAGLP